MKKSEKGKLDRREFLQAAITGAAAAAVAAAPAEGEGIVEQHMKDFRQTTIFAYGYDKEPYKLEPGTHLMIDTRYIYPGRIQWRTAAGEDTPLFAHEEIKNVVGSTLWMPYGIKIKPVHPEKIGPIIPNDKDWEFMIGGCCSLHDLGGKYGLWYEVVPPKEDGNSNILCYAESSDGVNWTKPELGLVDFRGSKKNNIVIDGKLCPYKSFHGNSVFIDPLAPAEERFKVIYMGIDVPKEVILKMENENPESVDAYGKFRKMAMFLGSSPDGIRWSFSDRPLFSHMCDTQTCVYWDEFLRRYVIYTRTSQMNRRGIGRCETADINRWPAPETIVWNVPDGDVSDDLYCNSKSLYPGTKTMHLMFPTIYKRRNDACPLRMMSSIDGLHWQWLPDEIMQCGPQGAFDHGCFFAGFGLTEISGNRVALPYGGYAHPHKYPRWGKIGAEGLAVWQKGRLAAFEAEEEAEFWMNEMVFPGDRLFLNYETKPAGYIKVEIVGDDNRQLGDCDPLIGNELSRQVTWKGNGSMGVGGGKKSILRFKMRSAKLFSFEVK